MKALATAPTVGVRFPPWFSAGPATLAGIDRFMREHGPWKLVTGNNSYGEMEAVVIDSAWHGDAALLFRATEAELDAFRRRGMAVVLTSSEGPDGGFPRVVPDHRAIGALAAGHLIECGLDHFAYLGRRETLYREAEFAPGPRRYSVERLEGFRTVLSGHFHEPHTHLLSGSPLWRKDAWRKAQAEVENYLKSLPAPCGLFVADDSLAAVALKAAEAIGRQVPESLAVIGYGDDHSYCYAGYPALSSIRHPAAEIGWRAARLLWLQMRGEAAGLTGEVVPVTEVVPRKSSAMLAIDDPRIREWVGWVRRVAPHHPLRVSELAEHAGVSLSTLKAAFATVLGHSPKQEITRVRMSHLSRLLQQPALSITETAAQMGFPSTHELARFCRAHSGLPPDALRHNR